MKTDLLFSINKTFFKFYEIVSVANLTTVMSSMLRKLSTSTATIHHQRKQQQLLQQLQQLQQQLPDHPFMWTTTKNKKFPQLFLKESPGMIDVVKLYSVLFTLLINVLGGSLTMRDLLISLPFQQATPNYFRKMGVS
jgi:hypothetical protein